MPAFARLVKNKPREVAGSSFFANAGPALPGFELSSPLLLAIHRAGLGVPGATSRGFVRLGGAGAITGSRTGGAPGENNFLLILAAS
jgi:hypothetical protein